MLPLPPPRARLAGCCWLPRVFAKIRRSQAGALPPEYTARICAPDSVDFYFLEHFGLTREALLSAVSESADEAGFVAWFTAQPGVQADSIASWNVKAEKLGQPGQPMEGRYRQVMSTTYAHLAAAHIRSIFDVITADETPAA